MRRTEAGTSVVLLPNCEPDELVLTFAGNVVKHLGVQMYAGRPVPAIAELISNSWDADANNVRISLPLGQAWDQNDDEHVIVVEDDGHGMTWGMVRDAYLDVGRDRRDADKTDRSRGGRLLQGRKGIGKLAGFGIADVVEVQTVHEESVPTVGEQVLLWFELRLEDLKRAGRDPAPVRIIFAGPISQAPPGGRIAKGTTVTMRRPQARRAINQSQFMRSMARRFLLLGPRFRVTFNDEELKPEDYDVQWRWPDEGWKTDDVEGCGPVDYWVGFAEKPLRQSDGDLSGILVFTRGKVSQEATFFDISGGVTGQHGLRYMCGMVRAEWLDGGPEQPDLIATHRGGIAWESPQGQAFQRWGQSLVKKRLAEWARRRRRLRERHVREVSRKLKARIDGLAPAYRTVAATFIEKFTAVEMEPEEFEDILSWFLDALENATLRRIIERLRETEISDLEELDGLLSRMEIRTALSLLQVIDSNLAAIAALKKMHLDDARERGVIARHLEKNPWLIHPTWMLSKAEGQVSTWIRSEFGLESSNTKGDRDRVDFFCVAVGGTLHIVEIKRGGHVAGVGDILQADRYRQYVKKRYEKINDPEAIKYGRVVSHLVAKGIRDEAEDLADAYRAKEFVIFTDWKDLIDRAKLSHQQFRTILKKAAGEEEP